MKVTDYQCVWAGDAKSFTRRVQELIEEGYELYGPPMLAMAGSVNQNYYSRFDHTLAQVLVKPIKERVKKQSAKSLPIAPGLQSCGNCACDSNTKSQMRSCGRTES